jgi:hypothetical protein
VSFRFNACVPLVALAAVGCGGAADVPATPDLRALIASYDAPNGELDSTQAGTVIANAPPMPELAAGLQATGLVAGSVNTASTDNTTQTSSAVRLQGSINVDFRCPGDLTQPVYDPATNGSASLTFAVQDNLIKRAFGGTADNCVLLGYVGANTVSVHLQGTIAFDLGSDIGIGHRWSGRLLAFLPGELTVGSFTFTSLSARFTQDMVEYLVHLDDGTNVVLTFTSSGLSVRDKSGSWFCPSGQTTCNRG